ncbi:hypothetical protein Drorol1_Dr00021854 [Drosera rotundifolia]
MEALSIWASNFESRRVTQVEFRLGFSSFGYRTQCRRKRSHFDCAMFARGSPRVILVYRGRLGGARHGGCDWINPGLHVGLGFSGRIMGREVAFLGERNGGAANALVGLDSEVEDKKGGNSIGREDSEGSVGFHEMNGVMGSNKSPFGGNGDSDDGEGVGGDDIVEEAASMERVVRGLAKSLQFAKSVEDVERVLEGKGRMSRQAHLGIIRLLGRGKKLDAAIALVEWLKKKSKENDGRDGPNVWIYNSLAAAVKDCGQFEKFEWLMYDMSKNGISPDIVTYNTLMAMYVEQGRSDDALSLFKDLHNKGLSPSPASYSTAMLAYRRLEDGIGAVKLYCTVKEKFLKGELEGVGNEDWHTEFLLLEDFVGRICYQVIRQWLLRDYDMSTDILKLLTYMDAAGTPPSKNEYERLIWACSREQHYLVVKEFYQRLKKKNYKLRLSVCNHAIWLMGKAKMWWVALEIYEDMLEKGLKPSPMSYELIKSYFKVMLNEARRSGKWRLAAELLNKMEEKGLKPGNSEWNAVLLACSRPSETAVAAQVFLTMVDRGLKPTTTTYGALLSALEKGKQYDRAFKVWEHMKNLGIKPNIHAYTVMATIYVALGKFHEVDLILQEMISTGVNPTVLTYNAIISCCVRNGLEDAAYEWFDKMRAQNISANEFTYEMLIKAHSKDTKPKLANEMFPRAHEESLSLAAKANDAVIQS